MNLLKPSHKRKFNEVIYDFRKTKYFSYEANGLGLNDLLLVGTKLNIRALNSNIRIYPNCYNKLAPTIVLTKLALYYDCKVLQGKNSNNVRTLFEKLIHRECILWNLFNKMSCISLPIRSKDCYSDSRIVDVLKKFNKDLERYLEKTTKIKSKVDKLRRNS